MRTLLTGATGFIGRKLVKRLSHPAVLTHDPDRAAKILGPDVEPIAWNAMQGPPPVRAFTDVDTVINLAGESIMGRWTDQKKAKIHDSRVLGTRNLIDAIAGRPQPPKLLINASAVGFYGDRGDEQLDETALAGHDFLAQVCRDWETEALKAQKIGLRVVLLRLGLVIGPDGGFLSQMLTPFRLGLGARLSHGRQWMSWVHLDDVLGIIDFAIQQSSLDGPVNTVSPNPVTNAEFTQTLGRILHRPAPWRIPRFVLNLALGQAADSLLASQRVLPSRLKSADYAFKCSDLSSALSSSIEH